MSENKVKPDTAGSPNPLVQIMTHGQSIWFDYIKRSLITSGDLQRMVDDDDLRGLTSNPSIFEKAIAGSDEYKIVFDRARAEHIQDAKTIYERIAIEDIRMAADVMNPVYVKTQRRDGYISLEVSPALANDARKTCQEARRLWKEVNRENLMIKVPATPEGIIAVQELIGDGINVNVTLIFSRKVYREVADAYIAGLEKLAERETDLSRMASVSSFFVSRIDTEVEKRINERLRGSLAPEEAPRLEALRGRAAIANAKLAYLDYKEIFGSARWRSLEQKNAQTQRLLWASTGTKNPKYSDVLYVEELIGPNTVNTVPPATYKAFREHGRARASLDENCEEAGETMLELAACGISFDQVTDRLLEEGLAAFSDAFERLIGAIRESSR